MIVRDYQLLEERLEEAKALIRKAKDEDESMALANYIEGLCDSIVAMGKEDYKINSNEVFRNKRIQNSCIRKVNVFADGLTRNFVLNKGFHQDFLGEILPEVEKELYSIYEVPLLPDDILTEKEFFDILYMFLSYYNLDSEFHDFYNNGHVFSTISPVEYYSGYALYNPISMDSDIFITDFKYSFSRMNTLVHEFGHAMDINRLTGGVIEYNNYFYNSIYGEVFSRLMERLLHQYCLNNGIFTDQVRDSYIEFEDVNHDLLLQSYILSLLDDQFIYSYGYMECDSNVVLRKVKKYFTDENAVREFLEESFGIPLSEALNYAYGDIISMFLADEVQRYGLSNELVNYFLQNRVSFFSEDYMRECGFGPQNYVELYKKEIELIKK